MLGVGGAWDALPVLRRTKPDFVLSSRRFARADSVEALLVSWRYKGSKCQLEAADRAK